MSGHDEMEDAQLDPQSLAGTLDQDPFMRARLRYKEQGKLLRWPMQNGKEAPMSINMNSIALNVRALKLLAKYWCPKTKVPKPPGINLVRDQAWVLKKYNMKKNI